MVSDVTKVSFDGKKLYLCVIIDLYARKIIAYKISEKNNTSLTKKTFNMAYNSREPKEKLLFLTKVQIIHQEPSGCA